MTMPLNNDELREKLENMPVGWRVRGGDLNGYLNTDAIDQILALLQSELTKAEVAARETLVDELLNNGKATITKSNVNRDGTSSTTIYATCSAIENRKIAYNAYDAVIKHPQGHKSTQSSGESE